MIEATEIYIYESEIKSITAEAQRYESAETGGDLFGSFTHGGMPIIWLASGPGPGAQRTEVQFAQDPLFTSSWQRRLMSEFGIQYVGSWHSHHTLGLKQPSGGDVAAAQTYAHKHSRSKTLELLLNHEPRGNNLNSVARAFYYLDAPTGQWTAAKINVLRRESPLRSLLGRDEQIFSAGVDWQAATVARLAPVVSSAPIRPRHREAIADVNPVLGEANKNDNALPEQLISLIGSLNIDDITLEQRGDVLMMIVPLESKQSVAIAIQVNPDVQVLQANYIDKRNPDSVKNQNMADLLRSREITLPAKLHDTTPLQTIIAVGRREAEDPNTRKRTGSFPWNRKESGQK